MDNIESAWVKSIETSKERIGAIAIFEVACPDAGWFYEIDRKMMEKRVVHHYSWLVF